MAGDPRRETRDSGSYHFHYDREERLAGREEPSEKPRGILRGNRSLTLILLDVIFVLIVFVLYFFFFSPEPGVVRVDGYRVAGNAFVFDGELYVTVSIEADEERTLEGEQSLVWVTFPDGERLTDVLPATTGFPTVLRRVVESDEPSAGDEVRVTIAMLGTERELVLPVTGERGD